MTLQPITINPRAIVTITDKAGKFVFKKEAEKELLKLLEVQELINQKVEEVKAAIAEAGTSIDENFRGVIGENVRAIYRRYGERFGYDRAAMPEKFLKETKYFKVDSAAVDEYFKITGELPDGIFEKDRSPVISLTVSNEKEKIAD